MSLEGKVVVITGGAMGIGRHIAKTFAGVGAKVVVTDIASMEDVAQDLRNMAAEFLTIKADVTAEDQVKTMVDKVIKEFGRIDVLINNHGIVTHFYWGNPATDFADTRWPLAKDMDKTFFDKVMNTNLGGTFLTCKHVIPFMEKQGSGCIINFGQNGAAKSRGAAVYATSKAAIQTYSRHLAEEVRDHNILVLSMSPGAAIAGEYAPEEARGRLAPPEVVANCFVKATELGMENSGMQVICRNGELVISDVAAALRV